MGLILSIRLDTLKHQSGQLAVRASQDPALTFLLRVLRSHRAGKVRSSTLEAEVTTQQRGLSHIKPGAQAELQAEVGKLEVGNNLTWRTPAGNSQEI